MLFRKKISLFVSIIAATLTLAAVTIAFTDTAHAQIPNSISGIEISATPSTPQPGNIVTVEVKSYTTDLNGAKIVWYENGKALSSMSGTGKTKYTFTAPKNGTKLVMAAYITTVEGKSVQKSVTIQPNSVDMIIETNGYTVPFYRGKAAPAYQNSIKFIAVPHFIGTSGVEIDPKKLVYTWKKNSTVLQDRSGYGKQSVIITSAVVPRPYSISVEINSADGQISGSGELYLDDDAGPSVLLYEEDPLYGALYNNTLKGNFRMKHSELSILAAPFSFNTNESDSTNYVWSINNSERPDLGNKRGITLRVKDGADGNSNISLNIRNQESILQGSDVNFNAYFSKKNSGGIDGLGNYSNPF
jgi:hypothetical protein